MKNLNLKILTGALFLVIASVSCSKHCDDEDYTRDVKVKKNITSDSVKVSSQHHSES